MHIDSPAYRAAMDRAAAEAIGAITNQAHRMDHLDSAEAIHLLSLALQGSQMSRAQLAASLAVHVVRVDAHDVLPPTTRPASRWKVRTLLAARRVPRRA